MMVPDDRLHVVVGVILKSSGRLLIQQRRQGTPRAGQWEFPGGKVEPGESPREALERELGEELGIRVECCQPLIALGHDYEHARVWLDTWLVSDFQGQILGREGQMIAWVPAETVPRYDVLEAVHPILDAFHALQEQHGT